MKKVAFITGGTGGLGSRVARKLWESGYRVAINYRENELEAKRLLIHMPEDAVALKADIGEFDEITRMAEEIGRRWKRLDVLVNCAGTTRDSLLVRQREEDWDDVIRVNLTGTFNVIRACAGLMKDSGGGHIINVSSYSGVKGKKGQTAYSASKAALLGLTYSAAAELAPFHIRVNAVLPGYMATEMGRKAGEAMTRAAEDSLLGRLSDPEEVASFIAHLVETRGITGQVFAVESRIL
jgi:3-oxoacyl-[acyl-carrier protein] reductase